MIVYVARYVSPDNLKGYIELEFEGTYSDLFIKHYYLNDNELTDKKYKLNLITSGLYEYDIPKDVEFYDKFEIYNGNILIGSYITPEENAKDPFSNKQQQIPKSDAENRVIRNDVIRLWNHYTWTPFRRKISIANAIPSGLNATNFKLTVRNSNLFENAFNPTTTTRDAINDMLSNPQSLFEGENGQAFFIKEENKIVVPLSNYNTSWTEEFDANSFFTLNSLRESNDNLFSPNLYAELTDVGVTKYLIDAVFSSYNSSEIPSGFLNDILSIEDNYVISSIDLSLMRLGDGSNQPFELEQLGGVLYGEDNFNEL